LRRLPIVIMLIFVIFGCGKKLPDDKTLFAQAQKYESEHEYAKASETYELLIDNYPSSPLRYKALFMAGFVQFEQMKDNKKAIELFDRLIKDYPDCDLADDAAAIRIAALSGKDLLSVLEDSLRGK